MTGGIFVTGKAKSPVKYMYMHITFRGGLKILFFFICESQASIRHKKTVLLTAHGNAHFFFMRKSGMAFFIG